MLLSLCVTVNNSKISSNPDYSANIPAKITERLSFTSFTGPGLFSVKLIKSQTSSSRIIANAPKYLVNLSNLHAADIFLSLHLLLLRLAQLEMQR